MLIITFHCKYRVCLDYTQTFLLFFLQKMQKKLIFSRKRTKIRRFRGFILSFSVFYVFSVRHAFSVVPNSSSVGLNNVLLGLSDILKRQGKQLDNGSCGFKIPTKLTLPDDCYFWKPDVRRLLCRLS